VAFSTSCILAGLGVLGLVSPRFIVWELPVNGFALFLVSFVLCWLPLLVGFANWAGVIRATEVRGNGLLLVNVSAAFVCAYEQQSRPFLAIDQVIAEKWESESSRPPHSAPDRYQGGETRDNS
jgi:hypothetical protein